MKKTYETPMAEKLAFNYRNQVVAASGVNTSAAGGSGSGSGTGSNSEAGWTNNLLSGCVSSDQIGDYIWTTGILGLCN